MNAKKQHDVIERNRIKRQNKIKGMRQHSRDYGAHLHPSDCIKGKPVMITKAVQVIKEAL